MVKAALGQTHWKQTAPPAFPAHWDPFSDLAGSCKVLGIKIEKSQALPVINPLLLVEGQPDAADGTVLRAASELSFLVASDQVPKHILNVSISQAELVD